MKKFLFAALIAALIVTMTAAPVFAEELEAEITETVEAATEEAAETEDSTQEETEEITEEVTEEITEEVTEEEATESNTEPVDGAIVEQDYLTRMMEKVKDWFSEHPELVGSFTASGGLVSAAIVELIYLKKSRKRMELKADDMNGKVILLNNNAVELVETAKETVNNGKDEVSKSNSEVKEELRVLRMEVRAQSVLLAEMIKDARLPERRKEEIMGLYNSERSEEREHNEEDD